MTVHNAHRSLTVPVAPDTAACADALEVATAYCSPAPLDHSVRSNLTNEPPSKRAGLQDIEARGPAQRITCQLLGIRTVSTMYTLAFAVFTLPQTTLAESLTV